MRDVSGISKRKVSKKKNRPYEIKVKEKIELLILKRRQ